MGYTQRLVVFLTLFLLFGAGGLYLASFVKDKQDQEVQKEVEGVKDFSSAPQVTNVAPVEAVTGTEYRYDVSVVDTDTFTGDLLLTIVEGPAWLYKTGLAIYGTPTVGDVGTHKVVFTISDDTNTISKEFYIVVENSDEVSN